MSNQKIAPAVKFPVFETVLGNFHLLLEAKGGAWLICFLFAGIETILFALSGHLSICISTNYRLNHFCGNNIWFFLLIHSVIIFVECIFARNWLKFTIGKPQWSFRRILFPNFNDLKLMGVLLGYCLTLGIAGLSLYLLYIRVPNPDWHIELIYFAVVSLGFLVPLVALRFSCYAAFAALGRKFAALSDVWHKTSGNFAKIFFGAAILIMSFSFVMLKTSSFVIQAGEVSSFAQALVIEYIVNIIKLIFIALLINFCYIQYQLIEGSENNEN